MYLIREVFKAKPGQASKLAKLFRKTPPAPGARVMTDMAGPYNTVVMEWEVKDLRDWVGEMEKYKSGKPDPNMTEEMMKEMQGYTEMYLEGRREIYEVLD